MLTLAQNVLAQDGIALANLEFNDVLHLSR